MADGMDLYNRIDELAERLNDVLSDYDLQIGTLCGQYKNPVELTITVEEKDYE